MRLGRIASIVVISTWVAAPAPGPDVGAAPPEVDRTSTSGVRSTTRPGAVRKRDSRLAAAMPVADTPLPPSRFEANLRRSVEDQPAERPMADTKAKVAGKATPAAAGKGTIQLGAFISEAAALAAWAKISATSDGTLNGLVPITVPVPAKANLWRLRTTVSNQATARTLCAALVQRKLVCVVARD